LVINSNNTYFVQEGLTCLQSTVEISNIVGKLWKVFYNAGHSSGLNWPIIPANNDPDNRQVEENQRNRPRSLEQQYIRSVHNGPGIK